MQQRLVHPVLAGEYLDLDPKARTLSLHAARADPEHQGYPCVRARFFISHLELNGCFGAFPSPHAPLVPGSGGTSVFHSEFI